jgi:hypothetical protein
MENRTISFGLKEVMSSAGSGLIDGSDKSLVMFNLRCDPTLGNTTVTPNVFKKMRAL